MSLKISTFIILCWLFISSCHTNESNNSTLNTENPINVELAQIKHTKVEQILNYSGVITPLITTHLSFEYPGIVNKIFVNEGQYVQKGQLLASLKKQRSQGAYNAAQATHQQALDAFKRLKSVYLKGTLPEIEWEDVKTKLAQAESALQIAESMLNAHQMKAPSSGVIGKRSIEQGSSVVTAIPAFDLLDIEEVYIQISVSENEINLLSKNQRAEITVPAISQQSFSGYIDKIGVAADLLSKTYKVSIRVENTQHLIKPGMVCDVNINHSDDTPRITIPSPVVSRESDGRFYVFTYSSNSKKVSKRYLKVDRFSGNNIIVLDGLRAGEIIIAKGHHKLTDGAKVHPTNTIQ
ncbi:efflux RND transporter periplasmic adaptor subunit [Prolixibacteraceae bacterium JC049]|nr:efflux RND transporter periplasmic adaptor subunit [Prolixibacteraceae bacterium JC049]